MQFRIFRRRVIPPVTYQPPRRRRLAAPQHHRTRRCRLHSGDGRPQSRRLRHQLLYAFQVSETFPAVILLSYPRRKTAARIGHRVIRVVGVYPHCLLSHIHPARCRSSRPGQDLSFRAAPRPHKHIPRPPACPVCVRLAPPQHYSVATHIPRQCPQGRQPLQILQRLAVQREIPVGLRQKISQYLFHCHL